MFLKRHSIACMAACAVVAVLLAAGSASAARWGGSRGGWGGYNGGWGGYNGGWGYNNGWGYNGGWNRGYWGGGLGLGYRNGGYYPGYNYDYSPGFTTYTTPGYNNTFSGYYAPDFNNNDNQLGDRARIEVTVPSPDAQVFFDGDQTRQQGTDRMFMSPPLQPGKTFHYTIEARWMENGKQMDQKREVPVTAGQPAAVDFTQPSAPERAPAPNEKLPNPIK